MIKRLPYKLGLTLQMPEGLRLKITNLDQIYARRITTIQIFSDVFITIEETKDEKFAYISVNAGKVGLVSGTYTVSEVLTESIDEMHYFKGERIEIIHSFSLDTNILSIEEHLFEMISQHFLEFFQEKILKKGQPLRDQHTNFHIFQLEPERRYLELIDRIQFEKEIYYL